MKIRYIKLLSFSVLAVLLAFTSCTDDLDTLPIDDDVQSSASVYEDPASYEQVLAKCYAGLAVSGQEGPAGNSDISGIDEGFGQYLRGYFYLQELTTDEAIIGWNDQTIYDFHEQDWTSTDVFMTAFYYRVFYQVSLCNEFIRETTDAKLDGRGVSGALRTDVEYYRAEARFLRALSYFHAIDMFGNVPFVTEEDAVGSFSPEQISRADLFTYIESELLDIEDKLMAPLANVYGRVDQAAAWMLLSKLYLNAEVYTGTPRYNDVITYTEKINTSGYALDADYDHLFLADNHTADGVIFPITYDGINTLTYGGTSFIIHAATGGSMTPTDYGISGGWAGLRTTSALVDKFIDIETLKSTTLGTKAAVNGSYPVVYVPGAHQGWDPSIDTTVLASVNDDGNYEGYLWFADDNNEFKINETPSWDVNYGDDGADGTLDAGGSNIVAGTAGYYKINANLNDLTYTIQRTDWGLIGSATPGAWDNDTDMTFDPATESWTLVVDLVPGEIKFRANDDWALNYGDSNGDGILEEGGDNIAITVGGAYLITMKLGAGDYTFSAERQPYDRRSMFYTDGQTLEIANVGEFTEGYAITKFKNIDQNGNPGQSLDYPDTDFPMFRLADSYLMYAEAVLRGGNGTSTKALEYVNNVRERAYQDPAGHISQGELTLDFILDERAREFYWECSRRTDLVRFGQFSDGTYVWPWKGGVAEGIAVDSKFNLFPIPADDLAANPNLQQNQGY
ncbi:RagB/SusD family nutrient uptake outer membrane protein [Marinifilum caeruleilacunae]|uniref:RagB/SusD family nutrient uptake outer membrane protein n=1 Tax=Marinifilum caeruleilacunae TaxID=2499076 RepID=A0ABX1WW53_9BACT|nr:RagB/SusD family nutrient uptake outer membrane protein [Marinifilum caeruleilacunae]NOU60358.1 RagB/SusD family nutrient uptake outer membrane protein [Marinifilum caeruleilacunae]